MAQVCAEEGYRRATVQAVIARARVSSKAFYELFRHREECFLAAYDAAVVRLLVRVLAAYGNAGAGRSWPERLRAALEALLLFLASEPTAARICFVEVVVAGPPARARYESTTRVLAGLIEAGREPGWGEQPPGSTAVWVVHGVALAIRDQILAGRSGRLSELLEDLLYSALVPYVGQREALRVAGRGGA
jgi:AcrR family transcriptional regulator